MTKKHFVQFAEYVKTFDGTDAEKKAMAEMVAYVARRDNPRFDADRFFAAAGVAR